MTPYIVVCDFDGTITVDDVTNLIWDAHVPFDWRAALLPSSRAGVITPLQLMAEGYAEVRRPADELVREVAPRVRLRDGFTDFVADCAARAWPFEVVSHGLTFYIQAFLPPGLALTAFEGTFTGGRWHVALPPGFTLAAGQDFKTQVVAALRARHPGHATAYVGDGRLDFPAARTCDRIFAVRGSALADMCREEGVACAEFEDFREIAVALAAPR